MKRLNVGIKPPTPTQIKEARANAGHTQTVAAKTIHFAIRSWQQWEEGSRVMHPSAWELYLIKTDQMDLL